MRYYVLFFGLWKFNWDWDVIFVYFIWREIFKMVESRYDVDLFFFGFELYDFDLFFIGIELLLGILIFSRKNCKCCSKVFDWILDYLIKIGVEYDENFIVFEIFMLKVKMENIDCCLGIVFFICRILK